MCSLRRLLALALLALPLAGAARGQLYQTDFSGAGGWTFAQVPPCGGDPSYAWAVDATPASHFAGASRSAPASLNFNDGAIAGPTFGGVSCGTATSPPIDLAAASDDPVLQFWLSYEFNQASACSIDSVTLEVSNDGFATLLLDECLVTPGTLSRDWHRLDFALQRAFGVVELRFRFYGGPGVGFNDPTGPFIDDLAVVEACAPPTVACTGAPNSQSVAGARFGLMGSPSVGTNAFRLFATDTPPLMFAIAFWGDTVAVSPSGAGTLCVGGTLRRLPVVPTGAGGTPTWLVDLDAPPYSIDFVAGSTWHFQAWFRDGPATWNFSDAISVTFCD